jgi:hypothetical protein
VGVGEGKLYRRESADGGLEWAPPGQWWKEVHYVSSAGAYGSPTRYYAPILPAVPDDSPREFLARDEDVEESEAPRPVVRSRTSLPPVGGSVVVGSPALFGNVVWLA